MSSLRVLMVNKFHYLKGGSETYHFAVGRSLMERGHEVAWFAMNDEKNLPCEQSRYFVTPRDYTGSTSSVKKICDGLSLIYSFEARRKFNRLLEEFKPDVIHLNLVHRQITFSILDAPYLKSHDVIVVYTAHDYIPVCPNCTMLDGDGNVCDDCLSGRFSSCVKKRCVKNSRAKSILAAVEAHFLRMHGSYEKVDRIIAPSDYMRGKLIEGGFPMSHVVTMQNFAKDELRDQALSDCDTTDRTTPYFLYFGRISWEKGIDFLIEAFHLLVNRITGWRLIIVGDGPARPALESTVTEAGLKGLVFFPGFMDGDDLTSYVGGASFSVSSSRCRENMPFSIVESFAVGTPVIASRIGGLPELVSDGETGFLAEPEDVSSLADALMSAVKLCSDISQYRLMQARCRDYVLQRCDQSHYIDELISLYSSPRNE